MIGKIAFAEVADTSNHSGNQLIQKGFEYYEQGNLQEAIQNWEQVIKKYQENQQIEKQVVVRTNLAITYKKLGNSEQQINQWQQIVNLYRQLENPVSTARALTELAQAYSDSGDFTKAINILCGVREKSKNKYKPSCLKGTALEISITQKDIKGEVAGLGSLGEVYRQLAKYDLAIRYLSFAKQKLDFDIENISLKSKILNSLGNVYLGKAKLWSIYAESAFKSRLPKYKKLTEEADSYYQNAQNNFQSSYQIALKQQDKSAQMRALINLIQLNYHNLNFKQNRTVETASNSPPIKDKDNNSNNLYDNANQRKKLIYKALDLLDELPESQQKVYAAINLANLSADDKITSPLTQCSTKRKLSDDKILGLLNVAVKTANNLQDSRSKSFALGAAGHFYECQNNYNQA
ncbi:MAG: tetratricopeptide repeat protein [Rivularia sp. ALOHA_DT_140]|nr:tetratricopeptide repeat protein [Rivularia sp. ALOHA_DT_140]